MMADDPRQVTRFLWLLMAILYLATSVAGQAIDAMAPVLEPLFEEDSTGMPVFVPVTTPESLSSSSLTSSTPIPSTTSTQVSPTNSSPIMSPVPVTSSPSTAQQTMPSTAIPPQILTSLEPTSPNTNTTTTLTTTAASTSPTTTEGTTPPSSTTTTTIPPTTSTTAKLSTTLSTTVAPTSSATTLSTSTSEAIAVSLCSPSNPCENGGVCHELGDNFTCDCQHGYSGRRCTDLYDACSRNPCQNNATCSATPPSDLYVCDCAIGFSGTNCEQEVDDCLDVVCPNGKVCLDLVGTYECICQPGTSGPDCVPHIESSDKCEGVSCMPGELCVNLQDSYRCECPEGYSGINCSIRMNDLTPMLFNPCHDMDGIYSCVKGVCTLIEHHMMDPKHDSHDEHHESSTPETSSHNGLDYDISPFTPDDISSTHDHDNSSSVISSPSEPHELGPVFVAVVASVSVIIVALVMLLLYSVRSVKRARATRGTYSPSAQEMFGNSASDILKPPPEERLI